MTDRETAIRADLAQISALWGDLLDLPRAADSTKARGDPPMPLPLAALSLRFDTTHQLAAWAHLVHDEQRLTSTLDLMDTVAVCGLLTTHAAWLAAHPAGRDAANEIHHYAHQILELVGQIRAQRIPLVGRCPDCGAALTALLRNPDAELVSEIRCAGGHSWTMWSWTALGQRMWRQNEAALRALAAAIVAS